MRLFMQTLVTRKPGWHGWAWIQGRLSRDAPRSVLGGLSENRYQETTSRRQRPRRETSQGRRRVPGAGLGAVVADVDTQDPRLVNVHSSWLVKTSFVDYFHNILLKLGDALI